MIVHFADQQYLVVVSNRQGRINVSSLAAHRNCNEIFMNKICSGVCPVPHQVERSRWLTQWKHESTLSLENDWKRRDEGKPGIKQPALLPCKVVDGSYSEMVADVGIVQIRCYADAALPLLVRPDTTVVDRAFSNLTSTWWQTWFLLIEIIGRLCWYW